MKTVIKKCSCHNYYMDTQYGANMRVMNVTGDGKAARCTACGMAHILSAKEEKAQPTPMPQPQAPKLEETTKPKSKRAPKAKKE